jgi:hypothetical protein
MREEMANAAEKEKAEIEKQIIETQTSRISGELMRMQRRADSIAGDADFSKEREAKFHDKSVALNKAVRFWPMFRMFILGVGGYLQVTSVISYMKSKHIY